MVNKVIIIIIIINTVRKILPKKLYDDLTDLCNAIYESLDKIFVSQAVA